MALLRRPRARGRSAQAAHRFRPGDDARGRLLLGDRELQPPPGRARGRQPAVDPDRLLPDGLPAGRRREPHQRAAGARHVQERSDPQGDPGRLWLPAAIGPGQPTADLRGVGGPPEPGDLHERHPGSLRDGARGPGRRAVHPADRSGRSADHGAPDRGPGRRPAGRDPRDGGARRAGPGHHPHQEDGRGPGRLPGRAGRQGAVAAQRGRHPGAGRDPARPAPGRV